jgi:hypothetical protein
VRRDDYERARGAQPVRELVQRVVDHHRLHLDIREERLFAEWPAFVGEKIGSRTRPYAIVEVPGTSTIGSVTRGVDRTLIVEVATSSWLHELRLLRPKIVADLLDKLGMPRIFDDIKLVLAGERKRHRPTVRPAPRRPPPPRPLAPFPPATGRELQQILCDAERVEDPELRALIARVRIANDR